MLASADRIPALRRQLDGMHPYVVATNPLLARRRELLVAELEVLLTGAVTQTETVARRGRPQREETRDDE